MEPEMILGIIAQAEAYTPVLQSGIAAIQKAGKELGPMFEDLRRWSVERTIASVRQFEDAGFTRQDAILLTLTTKEAYSTAVSKFSESYNSNSARKTAKKGA